MRERLWRVFLGILLSLVAFTTSGYSVDPWTHTQMSVYGDASRWDCGHFYDGACRLRPAHSGLQGFGQLLQQIFERSSEQPLTPRP